MIEATPSLPLIATTHEEAWLADIVSAQDTYSPYYMGIKYGTLTCVDDNVSTLLSLVEVAIAANAYKWKTLFNTLDLEYNPIWNYDGTNTITEVRGARDESHIKGARDSSNIMAQTHITSENAQAPYDSSNLKDVSKNETTGDAHTDRYTSNTYTDRDTATQYTDTITEVKGGNQGTTTTQQMIREEREIANMDYIDTVYKDIIDTITYPFYS
jgi:hypothetical protein